MQEIVVVLLAGLVAGLVCRHWKTSVLVGYLLAGVLIGKGLFGWVSDANHEIEYLAEAGVFLLLFSIGLEFSLDELARLGRHLFVGGGVQMLLVALPTTLAAHAIGMTWQAAIVTALAVSFSSTVLVFKSLSELGHAVTPHGRRAIGILLFQDAALVPLLLLVPLLTGQDEAAGARDYVLLGLTSAFFVASVLLARLVLRSAILPLVARYRSVELLVLLTVVVLSGTTLAAHSLGLPPAVGAFSAGLMFSDNRRSAQIDALILPFREVFAAVFFVSLGSLLDPALLVRDPLLVVGGFAGVLVVKALAALFALRMTGLGWKTAAGTALGLSHIGEFAFVLMLLAWKAGAVDDQAYRLVVTLAVGSLILTPFFMRLGLRWIDTAAPDQPAHALSRERSADPEVQQAVVIGIGPIGQSVASRLETAGRDVCLVDLSPVNLHPFALAGFRTVAGDATDPTVLSSAHVETASIVVVCVPDDPRALRLVREIRRRNPRGRILVRCRYQSNDQPLRKAGADHVVSEESQASEALARLLDESHLR